MGYSKKMRQDILNRLRGDVRLGLLTRMETATSPAEEISDVEYVRQHIVMGGDSTKVQNENAMEFPRALGSWGRVVAYGLFDASGSLVFQLRMPEPLEVVRNARVVLNPGDVKIGVD